MTAPLDRRRNVGDMCLHRSRGLVDRDLEGLDLREAVEKLFKVTVLKVRTARFMGKERRRGQVRGSKPDWKKAYVTLKEGDRIEFFEGV